MPAPVCNGKAGGDQSMAGVCLLGRRRPYEKHTCCLSTTDNDSFSHDDSYLVDPASSHMLVSKIKPCMSKYILLHSETANGSLNQSRFLR